MNSPKQMKAIEKKWESMSTMFSKNDIRVQTSIFKTIFTWKRSMYRTTWKAMIVWLFLWGLVELIWQLTESEVLQNLVELIDDHKDKVQQITTFVLGFYTFALYSRWWNLYNAIPWPDDVAMLIHISLPNPEHNQLKKQLVQHILLCQALVFAWLSPDFSDKYPTLNSLVEIDLLSYDEKILLKRCMISKVNDCSYWTPYVWFQARIYQQYELDEIKSELLFNHILQTAEKFTQGLGNILVTSDVSIPLDYTQVVTLLVWCCWFIGMFSCHGCSKDELPIPIFPFFISTVMIGWLNGTIPLLFPFATRSYGFDLISIFERNLRICKLMVSCPMTAEYEITEEEQKPSFDSGDCQLNRNRDKEGDAKSSGWFNW